SICPNAGSHWRRTILPQGVEELAIDGIAVLRSLARKQRRQRAALYSHRDRQAGGFEKRRSKIDHLHQRIAAKTSLVSARPANDHRNTDRPFVEIGSLQKDSVIAQHLAVVAHKDDDRM